MQAFDYVMTLMSFVYALAVAHILATVGDVVGAWSRVRFSWLNAAWMLFALFGILAWWIGLWGLRRTSAWSMAEVTEQFVIAALLYLEARMVCVKVAPDGPVDMMQRHKEEVRKYAVVYAVLAAATIVFNMLWTGSRGFDPLDIAVKNFAVLAIFMLSAAGAIFSGRRAQASVAIGLSGTWLWYFGTLQGALA